VILWGFCWTDKQPYSKTLDTAPGWCYYSLMNEESTLIEITTLHLWEAIYAARDSERYWKNRKNKSAEYMTQEHYSDEALEDKVREAKARVKYFESLAPADTW